MTDRRDDLPLDTIWPRLVAIADEMATTLVRTAFTHDVIEVHDMSTGLYDDRGWLISQGWLWPTGHIGVMPVFGKTLSALSRRRRSGRATSSSAMTPGSATGRRPTSSSPRPPSGAAG